MTTEFFSTLDAIDHIPAPLTDDTNLHELYDWSLGNNDGDLYDGSPYIEYKIFFNNLNK